MFIKSMVVYCSMRWYCSCHFLGMLRNSSIQHDLKVYYKP